MKEDIQICQELFSKNIFSNANPFYQSHLSMTVLYKNYWAKWFQLTVSDGSKPNRTKILTQFLLSNSCQVYIRNEPGQYFIEQILLEILNKAYYNKIYQKNDAEFLAFPLLFPLVQDTGAFPFAKLSDSHVIDHAAGYSFGGCLGTLAFHRHCMNKGRLFRFG